jgi:hypothetical protein
MTHEHDAAPRNEQPRNEQPREDEPAPEGKASIEVRDLEAQDDAQGGGLLDGGKIIGDGGKRGFDAVSSW